MNAIKYIQGFAWISLIALSLSIVTGYWLPMLIGAVVIAILAKMIR